LRLLLTTLGRNDIHLLVRLAPQILNDQIVSRFKPERTLLRRQAEFSACSLQLHKAIQAVRDGQAGYVNSGLIHKYDIVFVFTPVNS
jgi:hypothetical protein